MTVSAKIFTWFLVGVVAAAAYADEEQMILNMMDAQLESGAYKSGAACLGVSEQKLADAAKKAMSACFKTNKDSEELLDKCVQGHAIKSLGVTAKKFEACRDAEEESDQGDFSEMTRLNAKLDKLWEKIGDREPTKAEEAEIAALSAQIDKAMQEGLKGARANMEKSLGMVEQASQGTEKDITLPIYKNSKIKIHSMSGTSLGGEKGLPAATFSSPDSPDKIIAFYKKALPKYAFKDLGEIGVIFMETMPANFDILKHNKEYMSVPHVYIRSLTDESSKKQGIKSLIEIAYRKK